MVTRGDDIQSSQEDLLTDTDYRMITEEFPSKFFEEIGCIVEGRSFMKQEYPSETLSVSPQSPTCSLPSIEDWAGPYDFEYLVDSMNSNKKTWLYSRPLNKIFIDVFKSFPIRFKINYPDTEQDFCVRALPVYTVAQHMAFPVNRCPLHLREDEGKGNLNINHVVRCEDQCAKYEYDEDSKRFSVVIPLGHPQPGSNAVTQMYSFVCKSSCCGGMNRRPIMIIFTLEKDNQVVGRKTLNFRVCSCPKRDKEKEEKAAADEKGDDIPGLQIGSGKRLMEPKSQELSNKNAPPLKKRKSLFSSTEENSGNAEVYEIKVLGIGHYREVLRYLIMLKSAEYQETGSEDVLKTRGEYEDKLRKSY